MQKFCLNIETICIFALTFAGVVELVDTLDLGSSAARCESSSLSARTKQKYKPLTFNLLEVFLCLNICGEIKI